MVSQAPIYKLHEHAKHMGVDPDWQSIADKLAEAVRQITGFRAITADGLRRAESALADYRKAKEANDGK